MINGGESTLLALCDTLRAHHEAGDDEAGADLTADDILAYFHAFQLHHARPDDVVTPLPRTLARADLSSARPITLVISMDWIYLCTEDYALYPLNAGARFLIGVLDPVLYRRAIASRVLSRRLQAQPPTKRAQISESLMRTSRC